MSITVLAPAPVRHIPLGSRRARLSFAPVLVEGIELRELSEAEAPLGPNLPVNGGAVVSTRIVDTAIWRPIGSDSNYAAREQRGDGPALGRDFRTWLSGGTPEGHLNLTDLGRCLEGTPLLARVPKQKDPQRPDPDWNGLRQGTLLFDLRERMPERVRSYVSDHVALVDGAPYMRMPGPMAYLTAGDRRESEGPLTVSLVRHPGGWTTNSAINLNNLYRHDRLQDIARATGCGMGRLQPSWKTGGLAGIAMKEDEDLVVMLRESLRLFAAYEPKDGYPFDKGRCERLHDLVALGTVGAIEPAELLPAWTFVRDFAHSIHVAPSIGWIRQEARRIVSYARCIALPRLERMTFDAGEDAEHLAGLALR